MNGSGTLAKLRTKLAKMKLRMTAYKSQVSALKQVAAELKKQIQDEEAGKSTPVLISHPTDMPSQTPKNTHTRMLSTTMDDWGASASAIKNAKRLKPGQDELILTLPAGGHGSAGGCNLKCVPKGLPCTSAELKYSVYISNDWDCVKGGKLPGLFIGKNGTGGKSYEKDNGSARLMFRRNNQLVSYLYLCTDQGDISKQGPEFLRACNNKFPDAGIDLWRETKEKLVLKNGGWNTITYGIKLNEKGKKNGRLWLEVNGKRVSVNDACFTARPDTIKIGGMQWSCWYGGSDASWAPKKPQVMKFKDISLTVLEE
jgi:hypothetical protein